MPQQLIGDIVDLTAYVEESIAETYRSLIEDGGSSRSGAGEDASGLVFSCAGVGAACSSAAAMSEIDAPSCSQITSAIGSGGGSGRGSPRDGGSPPPPGSGSDRSGRGGGGADSAPSGSPVPRNVTMEEPYFSDELAARHVERLKRSVNTMLLGESVGGPVTKPGGPGKISENLTAETEDTEEEDEEQQRLQEQEEDEEEAVGPSEAEFSTDPEPPEHERWAVSDPAVDLSGDWAIDATEGFRVEYDVYLKHLGFGRVLRNIALSVIGFTTEETRQSDGGRSLLVRGKNPRGVWERTLIASGFPDFDTHSDLRESIHYEHRKVPVLTADSEEVEAEAWWERAGTVHRSWLRGGRKYGGGDFESHRYLEEGGDVLVCESVFHPNDKSKPRAAVTWRFRRVGAER